MSARLIIGDARHLELIEAMTECAFELGKTAAAIAQRAAPSDTAGFLAASAEARHCFFAVRMGIRLTMAQRAAARAAATPAERLERERPDPPEREDDGDDERLEVEREREGDYELVSLPRFLKRLGVVAANAERRRDDLPPHIADTTLPTLKALLAEAQPPPERSAPVAVLARPSAPPAARSRLLNSSGPPRPPAAAAPAAPVGLITTATLRYPTHGHGRGTFVLPPSPSSRTAAGRSGTREDRARRKIPLMRSSARCAAAPARLSRRGKRGRNHMILIGQYDSPFVRRVAIAMRLYGMTYEHRPWSVFGDAERLAAFNPLRRVPTLVLDDGAALVESGAILDWLDEQVGRDRALIPASGVARRDALRVCGLASGLADKAVSLVYERVIHERATRPGWTAAAPRWAGCWTCWTPSAPASRRGGSASAPDMPTSSWAACCVSCARPTRTCSIPPAGRRWRPTRTPARRCPSSPPSCSRSTSPRRKPEARVRRAALSRRLRRAGSWPRRHTTAANAR
jgi:hypothetical protein